MPLKYAIELGKVDAERFINLAIKEPFDYTEWRQNNIQEEINGENMRLSTLEKICKHFKVQMD